MKQSYIVFIVLFCYFAVSLAQILLSGDVILPKTQCPNPMDDIEKQAIIDQEFSEVNNKTIPHTSRLESFLYHDEFVMVRGNHKIFKKKSSMNKQELQEHEMRKSWLLTYPNISVDIPWGLPVEVSIISSFPKGVGNYVYKVSTGLQFGHPEYILAFNEASAKVMNTNFPLNDPTAVYTFSVDKEELVFHRHEGHRCIVGISGSGGAILRFSTTDHVEAKRRAQSFIDGLFVIEVPADSLFVLRFNGMVYHQFGPKDPEHPAFFAVSTHTNERGGELTAELLEKVLNGDGNIPLLTEPIPSEVEELLKDPIVTQNVRHIVLPRVDSPN